MGRSSGDAVSQLVACFNWESVAAVIPHWGGSPPVRYTLEKRERLLVFTGRQPQQEQAQQEQDGTAA